MTICGKSKPIKIFSGTDGLISTKLGKKVQVGSDLEKAQSEKDSHSKNRGGKAFIAEVLQCKYDS